MNQWNVQSNFKASIIMFLLIEESYNLSIYPVLIILKHSMQMFYSYSCPKLIYLNTSNQIKAYQMHLNPQS